MSHTTNNDNIYPLGTIISAKENPGLSLIIKSYYQRIYYCGEVNDPTHKDRAYFEKELIPPAIPDARQN